MESKPNVQFITTVFSFENTPEEAEGKKESSIYFCPVVDCNTDKLNIRHYFKTVAKLQLHLTQNHPYYYDVGLNEENKTQIKQAIDILRVKGKEHTDTVIIKGHTLTNIIVEQECNVCLEPLIETSKVLGKCGHICCLKCFLKNYNINNDVLCSLCRNKLFDLKKINRPFPQRSLIGCSVGGSRRNGFCLIICGICNQNCCHRHTEKCIETYCNFVVCTNCDRQNAEEESDVKKCETCNKFYCPQHLELFYQECCEICEANYTRFSRAAYPKNGCKQCLKSCSVCNKERCKIHINKETTVCTMCEEEQQSRSEEEEEQQSRSEEDLMGI